MIGQIEKSMMRELPVHYIPNGLDLTIFRPIEKETARRILNLPINRRLILFATVDTKDPRKGADLLADALMNLPDSIKSTSDLVIMGKSTGLDLDAIRMNIHKLGYIKDELLKALVYSASDIFAFPTRADNLPLVIQEAMACGTPTVSFDVGGVSELVRNGVTGFLSAPGDKADFSRHISNTLNDVKLLEKLHHQCTDISRKEYSIHLQAERYSNLSNSIISI
jgi:glycosyltransferase involved in cell wall biosynthesis